jgi:hypothetical protein
MITEKELRQRTKNNIQNSSMLNVKTYTSASEKKFGLKNELKIFKNNMLEGKVKYKISTIEKREKTTNVNETFKATLEKGINSGAAKTKIGIVKRKIDGDNPSASNLFQVTGPLFPNEEQKKQLPHNNPRMLSRQVASSKVARSLNLPVLSNEKYGLENDNIVGISAMLPDTAKSLSETMKIHSKIMKGGKLNRKQKINYLGNTVFSGAIQKQLSDLQLIDALVGQTDRHHGNIYLDTGNQRVYGIDNDQSFESRPMEFNSFNGIASFEIFTKVDPKESLYKYKMDRLYDESKGFKYTQSQIDINTAEKVLAMTGSNLEKLLQDNIGKAYGEHLLPNEIEMAKKKTYMHSKAHS